jgi:hypothetical protein
VDIGGGYVHIGRIFPFHDNPTASIRVLWYPVPYNTRVLPFPSIFVKRTWDRLDGDPQTIPGTDQTYSKPWKYAVPSGPASNPCGDPSHWLQGVSYTKYLEDFYGACSCGPGCVVDYPPLDTLVSCTLGTVLDVPSVGTYPSVSTYSLLGNGRWGWEFTYPVPDTHILPGPVTFRVWYDPSFPVWQTAWIVPKPGGFVNPLAFSVVAGPPVGVEQTGQLGWGFGLFPYTLAGVWQ